MKYLEMGAEDFVQMSTKNFRELVRGEAFRNFKRLMPISTSLDGEDIRNVTVWFLSFVMAWEDSVSSNAKMILVALLRKAAEALEKDDKCN